MNKRLQAYYDKLKLCTDPYAAWIRRNETAEDSVDESDTIYAEDHLIFHRPGSFSRPALADIADSFLAHPEAAIIYGDEDVLDDTGRHDPWFKPEWSPESFASLPYFGSFAAVRKSVYEENEELFQNASSPDAAFAALVERGAAAWHLPRIVFHAKQPPQEPKARHIIPLYPAGRALVVSIIIPSKDHPGLLARCIGSMKKHTDYPAYEIIVVDNGSAPEAKRQIEELQREYAFSYIYKEEPFNFSKMCNRGARAARGDMLLFLNDDIELIDHNWMRILAAQAAQEAIGAVGAKLYYPYAEGETPRIQHCGITNIALGPVHKLSGLPDDKSYYHGMNTSDRNVLAVTAACLAVSKDKFMRVGGFNEDLAVAYNDVELCIKLYKAGYRNVLRSDAVLIHHESISRGADTTPEKEQRRQQEWIRLYSLHKDFYAYDPYYSPHLSQYRLDVNYVLDSPADLPTGETRWEEQSPPAKFLEKVSRLLRRLRLIPDIACHIDDIRQCYSFDRKGDIQACCQIKGWAAPKRHAAWRYDTWLLFTGRDGHGYAFPARFQYRPDVASVLPGQRYAELSGFIAHIPQDTLPNDVYTLRIGMRRGRLRYSTEVLCRLALRYDESVDITWE